MANITITAGSPNHAQLAAFGTYPTGKVDLANFNEAIFFLNIGVMGVNSTIDMKLQHSSDGTSWSDLPGFSITQLQQAAGNGNQVAVLGAKESDVGVRYVRAFVTVGVAATELTCLPLGIPFVGYNTTNQSSEVVQVAGTITLSALNLTLVDSTINSKSYSAGTYTTATLDTTLFSQFYFTIDVGTMGAIGTIDMKLQSSSDGLSWSDMSSNFIITQLQQAAGGSNSVVVVGCRATDVGVRYVRAFVTVGVAASQISLMVFGTTTTVGLNDILSDVSVVQVIGSYISTAGPSTWYADYIGGNDLNDGSTFANRKQHIRYASGLAVPGDFVRTMASPLPQFLGQVATWQSGLSNPNVVTLSSAVTKFIADGRSNWTASSHVTCTGVSGKAISPGQAQQIAINSSFTTGLAAYFATGLLNLSAYNQLTFWIEVTSGLAAAVGWSLRLCSDTVGAVTVNNIALPDLSLTNTNTWIPITIDTGSALGSSIQSIALYRDVNNGAVTVLFDNIQAAGPSGNASSLTLTSLLGWSDSVGAGGADTETWYGIQSILGTQVCLDRGTNTLPTAACNWSSRIVGITSSTDTSPIIITAVNHGLVTGDTVVVYSHQVNTNANGTSVVTVIDANNFILNGTTGNGVGGTSGAFYASIIARNTWRRETIKTALSYIGIGDTFRGGCTLSGGWDTVSMSSQIGDTWFDGLSGFGIGSAGLTVTNGIPGKNTISVSKIGIVRYTTGLAIVAGTIVSPGINNCGTAGVSNFGYPGSNILNATAINNNSGTGLSSDNNIICTALSISNNGTNVSLTNDTATGASGIIVIGSPPTPLNQNRFY